MYTLVLYRDDVARGGGGVLLLQGLYRMDAIQKPTGMYLRRP